LRWVWKNRIRSEHYSTLHSILNCSNPQEKIGPEKSSTPAGQKGAVDLDASSLYVNRELSWLEFNRRVLEEAQDPLTPTLEKLKFASIFSSNLDEYFMVRVGGLLRILDAGLNGIDASGRTIRQQLDEIAGKVGALVTEQYRCILEEVLPRLKKVRIVTHRIDELDKKERKRLEEYFELQVFPILTPLAVDAGIRFRSSPTSPNLMAVFKEASGIKVPRLRLRRSPLHPAKACSCQ
jgi:polyphosphate kinase